jgi:hypothetical protein
LVLNEPSRRDLTLGRAKYGTTLGFISQWPSELASTILLRCKIVFAFCRSNERYQEPVQAMIAEAVLLMVPVLPVRCAFRDFCDLVRASRSRCACASTFFRLEGKPLTNSARLSVSWNSPEVGDNEEKLVWW